MILLASRAILSAVVLMAGEPASPIRYDAAQSKWLIDPSQVVSQHDTVYTTPSAEPWEPMPAGGGDLSAMVRCHGSLDLHLTKSDAWGFQVPPDAPLGSRCFNNVSPGHVCFDFGPRGKELAAEQFRQRLDLYRGRVLVQLGKEPSRVQIEVWGHPTRKIIVIEIHDPASLLAPAGVALSEWRPTMTVGCCGETICASEVQKRAARPHLANTGMQDFFPSDQDPLLGRGMAVVLGCPGVKTTVAVADASIAALSLPPDHPTRYHVIIAAAVTRSGDPLAAARREFDDAAGTPLSALKAEHDAWWRDYWARSFVDVTSPDATANRLCAAYHVHLYTLGCVHRGPYPAKWDGGPGLLRGDERPWGLSEWVQEVRFTYLPLYAANRLEMAGGLCRHYAAMVPYLSEQTRKMWDVPGLWIPETTLPWGHAEDFVLKDDHPANPIAYFRNRVADNIPHARFDLYNPYVGLLFTAGLEVCQHFLTYYRYSGDEEFLRRDGYPVLRGVCEFIAHLLKQEADGRYHLDPANALETWWRVRDPADAMAGIRAIFPEFVRLSEEYGQDVELREHCASILAALPEPALGLWNEDGKIDRGIEAYAAATAADGEPSHPRSNAENPALYRVFPFGLSGIDSPDHALARRTFDRRICSLGNGWAMDPIWAARLGMADEACRLAVQHAQKYQRFRYGGWTSNDSSVLPGGLSVAPVMDAGGLSAFALNEILLQSHNGILRIAPAAAATWSGSFRLRAEGGFLVSAEFHDGQVRICEIESLGGAHCTVANPWRIAWQVRERDQVIANGEDAIIRFATKANRTYLIEPAR